MKHRTWQYAVAIGFAVCLRGQAADDPCKEFGLKPAGGPSGYNWRADRCEGIFVQEVAGSGDLRLVSFSSRLDTVDPSSVGRLRLSWAQPSSSEVRLRAYSLRSRHYYRMDLVRGAQAGASYDWPTDVLKIENLKGAELGIVAWMRAPAFQQDVYLPLKVGTAADLSVVLQPGAELSEAYISFSRLGADGKPVQQLKQDEPLRRGYYPAGRGFSLPLPKVSVAGYYRLEAAGVLKNGGSVTRTVLLYLPAN